MTLYWTLSLLYFSYLAVGTYLYIRFCPDYRMSRFFTFISGSTFVFLMVYLMFTNSYLILFDLISNFLFQSVAAGVSAVIEFIMDLIK